MFGKLKTLFGARQAPEEASGPTIETVIAPERSFFAVGDIHGCAAQLDTLMGRIEAEAQGDEAVIFLGDAIDRGPASAQVLERLFAFARDHPGDAVVLMGNHERMMLDFIDDPSGRGARWLVNGGIETLESFGVSGAVPRPDAEEALDLADRLEAALPEGLQDWLRALPLHWQSGNVHCVHAAMNPDKAPGAQSDRSLLWGHPEFLRRPREDGVCVVHGHTIMPEPSVRDGRIALDTGAYRGGKLSAARLQAGDCRFLQA